MSKSFVIRISKRVCVLSLLLVVVLGLLCISIRPIQRIIYPIQNAEIVEEMSTQYGIPPSLIYAVIHTESKFDPLAHSSAEARGLMQITDDTYRWVCQRTGQDAQDPSILYNPDENVRIGVTVLHLLQQRFSHIETVLAAYNAGQGKVSTWLQYSNYSKDGLTLQHIPYEETANYVHRVINTQKMYQTLYNIA